MKFARYHVIKASRTWSGSPYRYVEGVHDLWLDFHFIESAREVVDLMIGKNPVGWVIIDSESGDIVE